MKLLHRHPLQKPQQMYNLEDRLEKWYRQKDSSILFSRRDSGVVYRSLASYRPISIGCNKSIIVES